MEPVVRFCTSADGTRIAYAIYGSGPPLFFVNTSVLSIDAQFTWPEARAFFDALAERTTLVIFDRRGSGASTREVDDLSPESEENDVAAVADAAGLQAFPLFCDAAGGSGVGAVFAAAHPERAERLIFWAPYTSNRTEIDEKWARSIRNDWSYDRRIWASRLYPEGPVSLQKAFSKAAKDSVSAEMAARRVESSPDLLAFLPSVTQPVLVIERERERRFATKVASRLPRGELRVIGGFGPCAYPDYQEIVDATFEFIGATRTSDAQFAAPSGTAIILFADIADSTALTERLGDAAFRAKARELDMTLRGVIREHAGTAIEGKLLGDGVLAVFTSARQAIEAALACGHAGDGAGLPLHLGLHAGDVLREENNVYGGAVNIAARISGLSAPGEVLVSDTVRSLARTSAGVTFEDRGDQALKGVGEPVRVWVIREGE